MSEITHNLLRALNYDLIADKRNANYSYLSDKLSGINRLNLKKPYAPFAYPLFVNNGFEIRRKLISNNIYIPTLWIDSVNHTGVKDFEKEYALNILPFPCDQRYGIDDMRLLFETFMTLEKYY